MLFVLVNIKVILKIYLLTIYILTAYLNLNNFVKNNISEVSENNKFEPLPPISVSEAQYKTREFSIQENQPVVDLQSSIDKNPEHCNPSENALPHYVCGFKSRDFVYLDAEKGSIKHLFQYN